MCEVTDVHDQIPSKLEYLRWEEDCVNTQEVVTNVMGGVGNQCVVPPPAMPLLETPTSRETMSLAAMVI